MPGTLTGRKLVVLGASAGIGQRFAVNAGRAGADLLLCGRRADALAATGQEAGTGMVCAVDLGTDQGSARLAEAAAEFGPIDAVVSSVGSAPLKRIDEMTLSGWMAVLQANVASINAAVGALVPHVKDGGMVLTLSSEAVALPRWGLGPYASSKAALETSFAAWRNEYHRLRFGTVAVGSTIPTDFAREFESDILGTAMEVWTTHGLAQEAFMDADELGRVLVGIVATLVEFPGIGAEHLVLRSPSPIVGSSELMRSAAQI
jgi:NAD(P)-dependent dehydrogenase (short-subunit alcohol dehydrogenase family)